MNEANFTSAAAEQSSSPGSMDTLSAASRLRRELENRNRRIVFAESCTAGAIAAALSVIPGASNTLCGGFVVYRNASKNSWLDVPSDLLSDPKRGPVSIAASQALAMNALQKTEEADCVLAITGDVGPGAPEQTDGHLFLVWMERGQTEVANTIRLDSPAPQTVDDIDARRRRLEEAVCRALHFAADQAARTQDD